MKIRHIAPCLVVASQCGLLPFAMASSIGVPKPDLAVDAPSVSLSPVPSAHAPLTARWTVRNAASSASPATKLEVRCTIIYVQGSLSQCASLTLIDIPPLARGDSYTTPMTVAATVEAFKGASRYRFNLTARVDPNNQIAESNEQNNAISFVADNFTGAPPSNISASPVTQAMPVMQFATNPAPWDPAKPAWLELKNVGPYDAPPLTVQVRCFEASHPIGITSAALFGPGDEKPCALVVTTNPKLSASTAVPAISKGQFKAIYEIKSFVATAKIGDPIYLPMEIRFHLVGATCPDLVLSNRR